MLVKEGVCDVFHQMESKQVLPVLARQRVIISGGLLKIITFPSLSKQLLYCKKEQVEQSFFLWDGGPTACFHHHFPQLLAL